MLLNRRVNPIEPINTIDYVTTTKVRDAIRENFPAYLPVIVDYGAGEAPLKSLFSYGEYITADVNANQAGTIRATIRNGKTDLPDAIADLVITSYVLEHVEDFWGTIEEITRLLKPGGRFIVLVPFINREHEVPIDFLRFTSFFFRQERIARQFDIQLTKKIGNLWFVLFCLWYERYSEIPGRKVSLFSRGLRFLLRNTLVPFLNLSLFRSDPGDGDVIYYQLLVVLQKR